MGMNLRFSLRTLIAVTTSLGLLVGWVTFAVQVDDRERMEHMTQLRIVQDLWGPTGCPADVSEWIGSAKRLDLNEDGVPEHIYFFTKGPSNRGACGFIVFTRTRGRSWPVFYYCTTKDFGAGVRKVEGILSIVSEGGRDHSQTVWRWNPDRREFPARWEALWRTWIDNETGYGPWHWFPRLLGDKTK